MTKQFTNGGRTPRDNGDRFIAGDGTSLFMVRVYLPHENREETEGYRATSLSEALAMAERKYAGKADTVICIPVSEYQQAKRERIEFNKADGGLL
jgi:hypothetical protein